MSKKIVCLDAGHGGHDSGAVGPNGLREKDATLEVVLYAEEYLKPFVDVVLTRRSDVFLSLSDRPAIANAAKADAFISYHFNAGSSTVALSWEIFTTRGQNNSDTLADCIAVAHDDLFNTEQTIRADRSDGDVDKEAGFRVIVGTKCPSCLMEGEFISTLHGENSIRDQVKQKRRGLAIAIGVLNFLNIPHTLTHPQSSPVNDTNDEEDKNTPLDCLNNLITRSSDLIKLYEDNIQELRMIREELKVMSKYIK